MRRLALLLLLLACSHGALPPAPGGPRIDVYATGVAPRVLLGDVDGDHARDLVILYGTPEDDRGITVRLGDGRGGFGEPRRILFGTATAALFDVDGDARDDLLVADGHALGLLPGARGPMQPLAQTRDPTLLFAGELGVLTTDGNKLTLHEWSARERELEMAPLAPVAVADVDADGRADLVGIALGRAAVRLGGERGLSPVRVLGPAERVDACAGVLIAWDARTATLYRALAQGADPDRALHASEPIPLPAGTTVVASDGARVFAAGGSHLWDLTSAQEISGPWSDIRALTVTPEAVYVADSGARAIAVIRFPSL